MGPDKVNSFTSEYSMLYDEIHANKDYESDIKKLLSLTKKIPNFSESPHILDFGCGTGKHLNVLYELGFDVQGYDPSESMIERAKSEFPDITFSHKLNDIPKDFDLVISLFDVLSYQSSNLEAQNYVRDLFSKLKSHGVVILDYWNLKGVQQDPPKITYRSFELNQTNYRRTVVPTSKDNFRITTLDIEIQNMDSSKVVYSEKHSLRAFTSEEIQELSSEFAEVVSIFDAKDYSKKISDENWRAVALLRKRDFPLT